MFMWNLFADKVYVVNRNVAIAGLAYLIYTTFSSEIEEILKPPEGLGDIPRTIEEISGPHYVAVSLHLPIRLIKVIVDDVTKRPPKPDKYVPLAGGMGYIYDPTEAGGLKVNGRAPIVTVPPPVLMTSENHFYAGPGEEMKDPDR